MAAVLKPGTTVQDYKTIELVGDGTQCNVYFASSEHHFVWLIQIEAPDWEPHVGALRTVRFEFNSEKWAALDVSGTSVADVAGWVDRLELAYIGWRWAKLAREIGYIHKDGQVLSKTLSLGLDRLVFNADGELIVSQKERSQSEQYVFPAPDPPRQLTTATDTYSLAAALTALAGDGVPKSVKTVLEKATDPDPEERYQNGMALAEALAHVLPNPNRELVRPSTSKSNRLIPLIVLLLALSILAAMGISIVLYGGPLALIMPPAQLEVKVINWQLELGCIGHVQVSVLDGSEILASQDVTFTAHTDKAEVGKIDVEPTTGSTAILSIPLGDFCNSGGALTIDAARDSRHASTVLSYSP